MARHDKSDIKTINKNRAILLYAMIQMIYNDTSAVQAANVKEQQVKFL